MKRDDEFLDSCGEIDEFNSDHNANQDLPVNERPDIKEA